MINLENDFLKVSILLKGAELSSLYNKSTGIEHLWQADPSVWGWQSPHLFPVVGGCINHSILIGDIAYQMERHGFARHIEFTLIDSTDTHAKFELSHLKVSQSNYPFKFTFQILYDLFDNECRVSFKVINLDSRTIYFSLGAHPAFRIPFDKDDTLDDYYLEFEKSETLERHLLSVNGLFTGFTEIVAENTNQLALSKELFKNDALVFKNMLSRKVTLKSKNHSRSVYLKFPYFNYFGIWGKNEVPFVCLEPWLGCADTEGKQVELKEKEAIQSLQMGHVFEVDYTIGLSH